MSRQESTGWLHIESAPKDGTAVLVMRDIWPGTKSGRAEKCNGHNTYVAEWWGEPDDGRWVCYMDAILDPDCPINPTHWMPLPFPPMFNATTYIKEQPITRAEQRATLDALVELLRTSLQERSSRWPENWTGVELSWLLEEGAANAAASHSRWEKRHRECLNDINVQNL